MPSEVLLVGIAQVAVTIAGFAGVVAVFREGAEWTAIQQLRLQVLVQTSLGVMFMALVPLLFPSASATTGSRSGGRAAWRRCGPRSRSCSSNDRCSGRARSRSGAG